MTATIRVKVATIPKESFQPAGNKYSRLPVSLLRRSYKWQRLWLKKRRVHPHKTKRSFVKAPKAFAFASTRDSNVVNSPVHTPPSPFGHKPLGVGVSLRIKAVPVAD